MSRTLVAVSCCSCKIVFGIEAGHHYTAQHNPEVWFYCTNGHRQHFTAEPTEADVLRRERDRLKQKVAEKEDEARMAWETAERAGEERAAAERRARAARGQVTRLKNRAAAGLCPCCNRSFVNLQRHMATQHKDFAATPPTHAACDAARKDLSA